MQGIPHVYSIFGGRKEIGANPSGTNKHNLCIYRPAGMTDEAGSSSSYSEEYSSVYRRQDYK